MTLVSCLSLKQHNIINDEIESIRKKYKNIGLSVVVVKDNRVVYSEVFGYNPDANDPIKGVPIRKNDLFYIASISKTFVGTAIMQLVEEGKLSIEDDVNRYLGFSLRNPNFPDTPITIRMLLSHRSSLKKGADYDDFDKINPEKADDLYAFFNDYPPGKKTDYSNLGFVILGAVVESVSGMRFDDYVQKHILKPLRLHGGYDVSRLERSKLVYPCRYRDDHFVVQKKAYASVDKKAHHYILGYCTPMLNPAGGLKISATDLAKYMMMHINKGKFRWRKRVVAKESEEQMWKGQNKTTYGLSFVHFLKVIPGEDLVGMNGANYGIHSSMYFHPEKKYGFVVICNGCNSKTYADSGLNNEIIRMLYNSIIKEN
jgi:CubicO group peptidase (beta-lactamase class C family)